MRVIRWEQPPPHGNAKKGEHGATYVELAGQLRANPGQWALVAERLGRGTAGPLVTRIRRGYGPFAPGGTYEARSSIASDGTSVYARYVGGVA